MSLVINVTSLADFASSAFCLGLVAFSIDASSRLATGFSEPRAATNL